MLADTLPTLQRKPRKGDRIGFGSFASAPHPDPDCAALGLTLSIVVEPTKPTAVVTRTPEGDDNLCWIAPLGREDDPRAASPFIWRFRTSGGPATLNNLARIFEVES